ncbi:arginine--tRNA ligase, partial [archaeon]|nr:arginine--tRNA ligase [archaeon]
GSNKTVIVEYPSVNIAKPMSIGHLRSAIIGQSLYNIHKFLGYNAISDDHIGDWGTQFGKLIYAYKTWGKPMVVAKNPIKELLALYVKFHEEAEKNPDLEEEGRRWFSKLEKGDREAQKLWKLFCKWSMKEFKKTYSALGLHHDYSLGESFYIGMARDVIDDAKKRNIAKTEQGAVIIPMNGTPLIIQKSDESTIYATRDLAAVRYRIEKFHPYKILYAVGSDQNLYFRQIFFAAKQLGYMNDEGIHVNFGLVSLPEGKMSTRAGRVVFLEDLINETVKKAEKIIKEKNPKLKGRKKVAEMVAMAAIKYNDLSKDRIRDIVFDWNTALSFEGDTGPYLQYTAVRANSVIAKSKKRPSLTKIDKLQEKNEHEIIKALSKFPSVIADSAKDYKPHYIANYLNTLAAKFNEYYHTTKIINSKEEAQRLALVFSVATVIKTGLGLLCIEVPKKM